MKLILPFPPSVNTYWRHPNKGAFAGKSLISAAGRKFQSAACAAIVEQLRRLPKPTSAPASVEIVLFPPDMGIVLFRPGSELMPLFMQGRVLLEPEPERYSSFASGAVPAASQPLADDPAVRAVFRNEAVIRRAGGVECLESWLLREKGCQWPHSDWHSENMTTMRHAPGAIRLCWHCDNQLRDQFTERLESMATDNCARWVLSVVRRDLGFDDSHVVTMPELCWWLIRNDLADALPESAARKALRLPKPEPPRESWRLNFLRKR